MNCTFLGKGILWLDRIEWDHNTKGGGICTYQKKGINNSIYKYIHLNRNFQNLESQWISVQQHFSEEIIVNCYRAPQGDIKECQKYLSDAIDKIDITKTDIFLIGDLNIDILDKKNEIIQNVVTVIKQKGLLQQIKDPTLITKLTATCIDLCFTNSNIVAGIDIGYS